MTYEIEINENSETGKKIFSYLNDHGIDCKPKQQISEIQKNILNESLTELYEGKVMTQEEVMDGVRKWVKSR